MTIDLLVCHSDIRIFKILWVVPISPLDQGESNESKPQPNKRIPKRMPKYKGDLKYLSWRFTIKIIKTDDIDTKKDRLIDQWKRMMSQEIKNIICKKLILNKGEVNSLVNK